VSRGQFLLNDGTAIEVRAPAGEAAAAVEPLPEDAAKVVLSVDAIQAKTAKEN